MKKKILIVSKSFLPNNSPRANRTTELAKELCRQGHSVTVLTPYDPSQEQLVKEYGMKLVDLGQGRWPEIPIKFRGRSNIALRALRRGMSVSLNYPTIEITSRILKMLRELPHHDVLISIAAPHAVHWGVARAFVGKHKPADIWLADCGDPFMGQENDTFKPAFYFKYAEKAFCRRAHAIVVPVEGAREAYYPEFRDKIHVIPQGFHFADYDYLRRIEPADDGVTRFAYAGLFIPGRRDPGKLLKALVARSERFEFHIFTKNSALAEPFARNDSRIIIRDFMPRKQLMSELAAMNFLVNIENVGARQSPSKLIDYWLCNRPVMNVKTNDISSEVIDEFLTGNYHNALKIDHPERYDISNVASAFDQLATQALASRNAV